MAIAAAYNEFPYESMPFSHSHPARLAAAAQLFGLKPPDIRTARVLELGCAAGGNLIPHAAYYPSATFVGIDLAGVQIAEGKQRIAQLGLTNIELREGSITDVGADDGKFDYIISHGLYCWVPDFVRDAVMRISAENLSPTGVAYISYNVYPGWHMKKIVRDLMLFHTLPLQNPRERVVAARKILADVHKYSSGAYHAIIAQEMENLESVGDYYIRHDQLAEENNPLLFTDFAAHAKQHGLEFIAEADLAGTFAESYMPALARAVRFA
jgi:SAM-dependent methyltransferase